MSTLHLIGTIQSTNRQTSFYSVSKNIVLARRNEQIPSKKDIIETFGPTWFLGVFNSKSTDIQVRHRDHFISSFENFGIIIPPFNLVHWRIGQGEITWNGYFTQINLFKFLNKNSLLSGSKPLIVKFNSELPKNEDSFLNIVKNCIVYKEIFHDKLLCPLAKKTKDILDKDFETNISISEIAKRLNCHRSQLTRNFKFRYGISPVEYRHMLRIYKSLELMNIKNNSVTHAALGSGFSNISRFNYQFKNYHGISASQYHFSKL